MPLSFGTCIRQRVASQLVVGLVLLGCGTHDAVTAEVVADCQVTPRPQVVGSAHIDCALTSPDGGAIVGASARMEANMAHPGMTPVRKALRELTPGRYEARFELSMAGDWYIRVFGRTGDERYFEKVIDLPGVQRAP